MRLYCSSAMWISFPRLAQDRCWQTSLYPSAFLPYDSPKFFVRRRPRRSLSMPHRINQGQMPLMREDGQSDYVIPADSPEDPGQAPACGDRTHSPALGSIRFGMSKCSPMNRGVWAHAPSMPSCNRPSTLTPHPGHAVWLDLHPGRQSPPDGQ